MKLRTLCLSLLLLPLVGCSGFERTTFQTLSASKAVLDQAQTDYESGKPIPHNQCAFTLINDGKAAQMVAVDAMLVYEQEKAAGTNLAAQTATVTTDLVALAPIIVKVQALIANPATCKGGK